ncbi:MAG: hypothetical protein JWR22_899 [Herminiimonas sp.]|nr:hypothetical protein [Herminiimonas sp.]
MTNHTKTKKPSSAKSRSSTTKFFKNLKVVDNIPEGGQLVINNAEFVLLFKPEIKKKLFKKRTDKDHP